MEDLIELVAASFARHGIECLPASAGVNARVETDHVGTAALSCPPERSSAALSATRVSVPTALPEHNFRKSLQEICP
jgi:hypothetical protein